MSKQPQVSYLNMQATTAIEAWIEAIYLKLDDYDRHMAIAVKFSDEEYESIFPTMDAERAKGKVSFAKFIRTTLSKLGYKDLP